MLENYILILSSKKIAEHFRVTEALLKTLQRRSQNGNI
jgi:hypothetical protein